VTGKGTECGIGLGRKGDKQRGTKREVGEEREEGRNEGKEGECNVAQ